MAAVVVVEGEELDCWLSVAVVVKEMLGVAVVVVVVVGYYIVC